MSNIPNEPRTFGMTRASTCKQVASPATQRDMIARACESLKLGTPQFLDEPLGTSGRSLKFSQRPMGIWALRNLRRGDVLVVTEIRTIGRNFIDTYSTVELFFSRGVRVVILKGFGGNVIDLSKSTDRLFLAILAWAADEEAARVSERTKDALDHRRQNGLCAGVKAFTYIQNYRADGTPITKGEYDKKRGDYKINEPDNAHLQQLCELLALQKSLGVNGKFLRDYCKERGFVNHAGERWWDVPIRTSGHGFWWSEPARSMKRVRRMAVAGDLPGDWNDKILAITGDTPVDVVPKWKAKSKRVRGSTVSCPTESDMEAWSAEEWRRWWASNQQESP